MRLYSGRSWWRDFRHLFAGTALASFAAACADPPTGAPVPLDTGVHAAVRRSVSFAPASPFGLNIGTFQAVHATGAPLGPNALSDQLDAVEQSGARWVRISVYWGLLQPSEGAAPNWNQYNLDAAIAAVHARGLAVLADIQWVPGWASDLPDAATTGRLTGGVRPDRLAAWDAFLQQLASRYGNAVQYWAILNEANCSNSGANNDTNRYDGTVADYDAMLLHAVANLPSGTVIPAEPALTPEGPSILAGRVVGACQASNTWLDHAWSVAGPTLGAFAGHAYAGDGTSIVSAVDQYALPSTQSRKPFFLTEFGVAGSELVNLSNQTEADSLRRVQGAAIYQVLRGMLRRANAGWAKSFAYELVRPNDDPQPYSLLSPPADPNGTPTRLDPWYLYRHVATNGGDWQPVDRWWRQQDNVYAVDASDAATSTYGRGSQLVQYDRNYWSYSLHPFQGWAPLFRCWYSDPGTNDAHFVTQYFACNDPELPFTSFASLTYQRGYGFISTVPRPDLDLVPLYRFWNSTVSDYFVTTDAAKAAEFRSSQFVRSGWKSLSIPGYVWPAGYTPQPQP